MSIDARAGGWNAIKDPAGLEEELRLDSLEAELRHLVGRSRAFLLELQGSERELCLLRDPRTERLMSALTATQRGDEVASLKRVEGLATELMIAVDASRRGSQSATGGGER